MDTDTIVATIASGYALPLDTARSIVRRVLELASDPCPPEVQHKVDPNVAASSTK